MGNRKKEILIVALHLFARDGYEAVSVSQIAGELDMTKGALYRHYKSKRDIFNCIVERMEQQDNEQASDYDMPEDDKERMPEKYETVSLDDFASFFLCKELIPGYLDGVTGEYATPEGYLVDEQEAENFDKQFTYKKRKCWDRFFKSKKE